MLRNLIAGYSTTVLDERIIDELVLLLNALDFWNKGQLFNLEQLWAPAGTLESLLYSMELLTTFKYTAAAPGLLSEDARNCAAEFILSWVLLLVSISSLCPRLQILDTFIRN